jgi:NTP pyrophosphatase (non-canonical NTP hydrolase)
MTFDDYQKAALRTARAHNDRDELFHLVLGLVGETGEVAEKFKKWIRDLESDEARLDSAALGKELGDVLWYLAVLASYLGISLETIASSNIAKLADRAKRDVIGGEGDNR